MGPFSRRPSVDRTRVNLHPRLVDLQREVRRGGCGFQLSGLLTTPFQRLTLLGRDPVARVVLVLHHLTAVVSRLGDGPTTFGGEAVSQVNQKPWWL